MSILFKENFAFTNFVYFACTKMYFKVHVSTKEVPLIIKLNNKSNCRSQMLTLISAGTLIFIAMVSSWMDQMTVRKVDLRYKIKETF
jgi:hypothetical protein